MTGIVRSAGAGRVRAVTGRRHPILLCVVGLLILAVNVVDAADRGASAWNFVSIACGGFLLFYGFVLIGRAGRPDAD